MAFHPHHPMRIFAFSAITSILAFILTYASLGPQAAFIVLVLMIIEITFSFENAIINARILIKMSPFWQRMFLTVGIVIAVFGMRLIFPILIVAVSANLPWRDVIDLALYHPDQYAHYLELAHPSISAFGGMFLLALSLHFFLNASKEIHWIEAIEKPLPRLGIRWLHIILSLIILLIIGWVYPTDEVLIAGGVGIVTYVAISSLSEWFTRRHEAAEKKAGKILQKVGWAGFTSFLYLELIDASFSLDGVIGAFAITDNVILIAVGLGVGAVWVRSLTIFMVRKKVLQAYRYLEHGAHYVIGILAVVLLLGLFVNIPEMAAGILGLLIIFAAVISSQSYNKSRLKHSHQAK